MIDIKSSKAFFSKSEFYGSLIFKDSNGANFSTEIALYFNFFLNCKAPNSKDKAIIN